MKMKAQKEQNEQTMTEKNLDLNESITYLEALLNDDDNKLVIFEPHFFFNLLYSCLFF
jgi:hypothetical protein